MSEKKFRIAAGDIQQLVEQDGGCIASDRITVDGQQVGYMYREPPNNDADTGWRFIAGDESDQYMSHAGNHGVYAVNTIANYDHDILPLLDSPIGSAFARSSETGDLQAVDSPIDPDDCLHPDFPVVTGQHQLTPRWSVSLPFNFNRRIEDGSLILWRPGLTLYFNAWKNTDDESIDERLVQLKSSMSVNAFDVREEQVDGVLRFSYHLVESGVNALYGFAITTEGQLDFTIYFDNASDGEVARSLFNSVIASSDD